MQKHTKQLIAAVALLLIAAVPLALHITNADSTDEAVASVAASSSEAQAEAPVSSSAASAADSTSEPEPQPEEEPDASSEEADSSAESGDASASCPKQPLPRSPQRIRLLRATPLLRSPLHIRRRRPTRHRPRIRPLRLMQRRLRHRPRLAARIQRRPRMQRSMRMCGGSGTCKNAAAKNCIRPQAVRTVNIWSTPWKNGIWR